MLPTGVPATFTPIATLDPALPTHTPAPVIQATATPGFSVYGDVSGEINLRYGPGADYPRLGGAFPGDRLEIVGYHTTLAWVLVTYPSAPNGVAWVSRDVLDIKGDPNTTRPVTQTDFSSQPTLTPTLAVQQQSSLPREAHRWRSAQAFAAWAHHVGQCPSDGFDPTTASSPPEYLLNLERAKRSLFGNQYAFSGTSINKVAILAGVFSVLDGAPEYQTAVDILNTGSAGKPRDHCLLARAGGGDMYRGPNGRHRS